MRGSLRTLSRRLAFFGINYVNYNTNVQEVERAVCEELEGPDQFLGYRSMHKKLREQHNLAVLHNLVYDVMGVVDPEGLERREEKEKRWYWNLYVSGKNNVLQGFVNNVDFIQNSLLCSSY